MQQPLWVISIFFNRSTPIYGTVYVHNKPNVHKNQIDGGGNPTGIRVRRIRLDLFTIYGRETKKWGTDEDHRKITQPSENTYTWTCNIDRFSTLILIYHEAYMYTVIHFGGKITPTCMHGSSTFKIHV